MYSDLMDRVLDGVLDSLLADRQVAFRYLLLRHRSHSDLSVAVSIDEEDYSLRELRPVHRWPRLMAVDGSRRSLGELCIKFDTSTGAWSLGRHLPADKTYSPNRITSVSATTSQAAQCDCAEINPWGRSWKLLIQFPGNQEGTMLVHHWADMSEVVKKMGYTLMKVYPDGALRRVDDEDKVPSDLRFLWLAGRPAVVKDGYEQKGLPRTLNLGDVEVVEWVKPLDTGARDGYEDMGGSVSETTSGRSTPESRDDVVESFDDKTRYHSSLEILRRNLLIIINQTACFPRGVGGTWFEILPQKRIQSFSTFKKGFGGWRHLPSSQCHPDQKTRAWTDLHSTLQLGKLSQTRHYPSPVAFKGPSFSGK